MKEKPKRHLFLTGPIGCGKSTVIAAALGEKLPGCGGFLTRRQLQPRLHFTLESTDGRICRTFLDFEGGEPRVDPETFAGPGVHLLEGRVVVLDEIGGVELLCPEFAAALARLLEADTPILGVIKCPEASGALIRKLGLREEYARAADRLRRKLEADEDTMVYECGQYDEKARLLAARWAEEYLHG